MMICRTPEIRTLNLKFIRINPLFVLLWIFIALILCTAITFAIIISDNPEAIGWISLITMVFYIIMLCTQTARNDSYFNTLIEKDNGKIILINFGSVFKNNMLFGNEYHSEGKLTMFIN